jgi:glycosyltransferase involved in cell wall biosynthesis
MRQDPRRRIGVNLLFISPGLRGGTVTYPRELLKSLVDQGRWDITVYVQRGAFWIDADYHNVRYREFGPFSSPFFRVVFEQVVLPILARRESIELLFSPGFVSPLFGPFRKVITVHDVYYKRFPAFVRRWQRLYWAVMIPLSLRMCDRVIAVSERTASDLREFFPWAAGKLTRIYSGSPKALPAIMPLSVSSDRYVLSVGNITPNKNIEIIVKAVDLVASAHSGITLKVVGRDLFGLLRRALDGVQNPRSVELLANVDDAQLGELYRNALCTVAASVYEGFGFPVLEAMAHGCPVVSSGGGALQEVGGDAVVLFCVDDPEDLAAAICRIDENHALRSDLVRRGYENLKRFSWDKTAQEVTSIFRQLFAKS